VGRESSRQQDDREKGFKHHTWVQGKKKKKKNPSEYLEIKII
jgi:hypothetical protein